MYLGNRTVQPDARTLRVLLMMDNTTGETVEEVLYEEEAPCFIHCVNSCWFAGENTAPSITTAVRGVGIGYEALYSLTTGNYPVGIGYQAAYSLTTGRFNVALGTQALYSTVDGEYNTSIGYQALYTCVSGDYNVALGYQSAYTMTGNYNAAVGYEALRGATTGENDVALGYRAGYTITTGGYNDAIGYEAMSSGAVTGDYNLGIGYQALDALTSGQYNICIGYQAGATITTGSRNVCIGYLADATAAGATADLNIGNALYGNLSTDNIGVATATFRGGNKTLAIGGSATNPAGVDGGGGAIFYSDGEMWVLDAAGFSTQLSPHDEEGRWIFNSTNTTTGERLLIDMEALAETIQELSGQQFITRGPLASGEA